MVLKRNPKYEIYWSKDNEWAIIDEEEEEEKAKRMKEGPPPDVASFVAGLLVVLVPATCEKHASWQEMRIFQKGIELMPGAPSTHTTGLLKDVMCTLHHEVEATRRRSHATTQPRMSCAFATSCAAVDSDDPSASISIHARISALRGHGTKRRSLSNGGLHIAVPRLDR
ncbi:hypothetical protein EsH8_I_000569 [Colletotrichum jinshuiense]